MSRVQRSPVTYPDPAVPVVATAIRSGRPSTCHQHTDADWELSYIWTGHARLRVAGDTWRLNAGDAFIVRPDEPHAFLSWRGKRGNLIFRQTLLKAMPFRARAGARLGLEVAGARLAAHLTVEARQRPAVEYAWERLAHECFGREPTKEAMCTALLAELLLELARSARAASATRPLDVGASARQTIEQLCDEVRGRLDHPWTLDELVRRSGYSATQLTLLFRAVTGESPCRWLCQERVRAARELLGQSDRRVTDIAVEVGFGSRSQFHRVFRGIVGATPARYRAAVRHEEQP